MDRTNSGPDFDPDRTGSSPARGFVRCVVADQSEYVLDTDLLKHSDKDSATVLDICRSCSCFFGTHEGRKVAVFSIVCLVEGVVVHHIEEIDIVSVINMNADDDWARRIERLLEDWCDVVRRPDHETCGAERFGIFHRIHRA
jgi:hypothetical protein